MANPLIGSRYDFHQTRQGAAECKKHQSYLEIFSSDAEAPQPSGDELIGHLHSFEVGSTVDGPGIRFVMFTTGCPLRCVYCHNPDTWHKANGRPVSVKRIMHEVAKYAPGLRISKGGVTLSGGEAVLQHSFITEIFRRCRALGLHTCLDTSGYLGHLLTDEELMDIDLHLLDIKSGDPDIYRRVTGRPLQPTLDFARRLSDLGRPLWVRFVLIPGLTDDRDNVEKVADICAGLKTLQRVEVLRFHQMGAGKWKKLGLDYQLESTSPPTPELTERVRQQFRRRGLTVF